MPEITHATMDKWEITTRCPTCHKEWTRLEYIEVPLGVLCLCMCDECTRQNTDEHGHIIVKNTKEWAK